MKVYFRILGYTRNLVSKLTQFFGFSVLSISFSIFNLALVIPMLNMIFNNLKITEVKPLPAFSFSVYYAIDLFEHFLSEIIIEQGRPQALFFICALIISSVIITNIFRYLERITASRIQVNIVRNLRVNIFENVSRLHIGFFNSERKGDLISRFTSDVQETEAAIASSLKAVFKEPITIVAYFGVLFFISFKLTLFTLIILPLTGGVIGQLIRKLKKPARQSRESMGRIVNILDETFSSMRVVKAFNARRFLIRKIEKEAGFYAKVNMSIAKKNELAAPVSETLGVIIVAAIILYGGNLVLQPDSPLNAGVFMGFLGIFASIIQPAKNFSNGITSVQKGIAAGRRIFQTIDAQPMIRSKPNAVVLTDFKEAIEFRNVTFAYEREPVLNHINLRIERGKTLALVGPSGGGKTTLADLIPRFYDPTEGELLIDGIPLKDLDLDSLRRLIGVVTQESILFNDTIYNNITFGLENVDEADVVAAARVANAHEFIMQAEGGYQTTIGERGSKLSGGQRQRLAIARAVLKNPPILVLDEATSALDSESERLVQDALTHLMQNRTSVVIAHRLSTIQHADEIIVIQEGRIIERGSHTQLVEQNGLYRKLSDIQNT